MKTRYSCLMLVNNETGVVQPIQTIARLAHDVGAFMHSDLAQAMGKLPWTVDQLEIDLGSLSAHKVHGPKRIGALYVRRDRCQVAEQQHGGKHERGDAFRDSAGTPNCWDGRGLQVGESS